MCGKRIARGSGCQHRICTGSPSCILMTDPAFRIALLSSQKHCPPFQPRNPKAGSPTIRSFDPFDPSSIPPDHRNDGARIIGHRDPSVITVRTPAREVAIQHSPCHPVLQLFGSRLHGSSGCTAGQPGSHEVTSYRQQVLSGYTWVPPPLSIGKTFRRLSGEAGQARFNLWHATAEPPTAMSGS